MQIGFPMANSNESERPSNQNGEGSQDALRHQKDALHHKLHKGRPDENNNQPTQERVQQDGVAEQRIEEQQAEISKVGSPAARSDLSDV
jgi:hypothetical protein